MKKELYEDKYGNKWTRVDLYFVHNPTLGNGVFDHGRGLYKIN